MKTISNKIVVTVVYTNGGAKVTNFDRKTAEKQAVNFYNSHIIDTTGISYIQMTYVKEKVRKNGTDASENFINDYWSMKEEEKELSYSRW